MSTIFDLSKENTIVWFKTEKDMSDFIPEKFMKKELNLPNLTECDVIRHYVKLSQLNYSVDTCFYPLGSCTMKYNPKINEWACRLAGFTGLHPLAPESYSQGALKLMYELERDLSEITGMHTLTLQPAAGAHGELTGVMICKTYFKSKGEVEKRKKILIPNSAHGTNPASAALSGFECVELNSDDCGCIDMEDLKEKLDDTVAMIMITNPNTLGIFEKNIMEISKLIRDNGSLMYCDGANMNAMMGIVKPADFGVDILHLNLHKTFSTPHGGGGPGSGPVGVSEELAKFLPIPHVKKDGDKYSLDYDHPDSIGKIRAFYGNFGVLVRAYTYIKALGAKGIRKVGEIAVLNANYLKVRLQKTYNLPYDCGCQHEFVLSDKDLPNDVTTNDVAKRLLDFGYHSPTVYFPLIVHGSIMIEPTETESKETLDAFSEAMEVIAKEAEEQPDTVKKAPHCTHIRRLDAVKAARNPILKWHKE